jgi:hypothetical protein
MLDEFTCLISVPVNSRARVWGELGRCLKKPSGTVGELRSAEVCVSYMPSKKAKKPGKLTHEKAVLER